MTQHIYPTALGRSAPRVPARDQSGKRLPLQMVQAFLLVAVQHAAKRPDETFDVQRDGWGYSWRDVSSVLVDVPGNVRLPC